jgi:hypothetical protein
MVARFAHGVFMIARVVLPCTNSTPHEIQLSTEASVLEICGVVFRTNPAIRILLPAYGHDELGNWIESLSLGVAGQGATNLSLD